jgi:DNA-binding response OmpR family regulator
MFPRGPIVLSDSKERATERKRTVLKGPARVLVVADEPIARFAALTLSHGIFEVDTIHDLRGARSRCRDWKPHLLILDIDVRDGDALALVALRVGARRTPTIVLTQRGDLKTKLAAFERGADDFMSTPIAPEELVARALAVVRRAYGDEVPFVPLIKLAGLEIDLMDRLARVGGRRLELTPMEQALLYLLASNVERTLDREEILDAIWGSDFVADSNLVDRHIRNLRVKLGDDWRHPRFIRTVPGRGYRFVAGQGGPEASTGGGGREGSPEGAFSLFA